MTTTTRLAGSISRLEVTPGEDVEVDDVVFGIVRLRVASDTVKVTADGDSHVVGLGVQEVLVVHDGPLGRVLRKALILADEERDRQAGRPPLELDGETVEGRVGEALEEDLAALEDELLGGDPPGADTPAEPGAPDPFEPDDDLELPDDGAPTSPAEGTKVDLEGRRFIAIDKRYVSAVELELARDHVVRAFGTDYVDEPSTSLREDLLGIEHVAVWLLRDLRLVEGAAGAREEVVTYLDGRIATTLERYATAEPWKGYKSSTVDTVLGALDRKRAEDEERGNWPELAEHVLAFEAAHKARKTILDGVEALIEPIPAAELPEPDASFEPTEDPDAEERGE